MKLLARILSHGFALAVVVLLALALIYRGDLFPDWELPPYLTFEDEGEPADSGATGADTTPDKTAAMRDSIVRDSAVTPAPVVEDAAPQAPAEPEGVAEAYPPETGSEAAPDGDTGTGIAGTATEPQAPEESEGLTGAYPPATVAQEAPLAGMAPGSVASEPPAGSGDVQATAALAPAPDALAPPAETALTEAADGTDQPPAADAAGPGTPAEESAADAMQETAGQGVESAAGTAEEATATDLGPAAVVEQDAAAGGVLEEETVPSATTQSGQAGPDDGSAGAESAEDAATLSGFTPSSEMAGADDGSGAAGLAEEQPPAQAAQPASAGTAVPQGSFYELLAAAREAYWLRDFDNAEKYYQALISKEPDNPDGYGELGNMYFSRGDWDQAAAAYYEAGVLLVQSGLLSEAAEMVEVIRGLQGEQADDLVRLIEEAGTPAVNQ